MRPGISPKTLHLTRKEEKEDTIIHYDKTRTSVGGMEVIVDEGAHVAQVGQHTLHTLPVRAVSSKVSKNMCLLRDPSAHVAWAGQHALHTLLVRAGIQTEGIFFLHRRCVR